MSMVTATTTATYAHIPDDSDRIPGGWVGQEATRVDCGEPGACPVRDWLAAVAAFAGSDGSRTQLVLGLEPVEIRWKTVQLEVPTSETLFFAKPEQLSENPAVRFAEALRSWLQLSIDELASLIGVSRSAIMYWKREDRLPRPTAARKLSRVYALIKALRDSVGPESLLNTLMGTRNEAGLSAMELLRLDRYAEAEQLLRPFIFRDQPVQHPRMIAWREEEVEPPPPPGARDVRPPVRRARRVSLRK